MLRNRPRHATRGTSVDRRAVFEPVEPRRLLANVPAGFADGLVAGGLERPVAMDFAPDGRIFVTEQPGRVRVIKNGQVQPTPFVTLPVSSVGERGRWASRSTPTSPPTASSTSTTPPTRRRSTTA